MPPSPSSMSTGRARPPSSCVAAGGAAAPVVASHHQAPSALWPAPATSSPPGVKDRSRKSAPGRVGRETNVVSERLNSTAMAAIWSSVRSSASVTTASGLPASGRSLKTSTRAKGCVVTGVSRRCATRSQP